MRRTSSSASGGPRRGSQEAGAGLETGLPAAVLVANRGEIAVRVFSTAKRMGLHTVAVYTRADLSSGHIHAADVAREVPSYLDVQALVQVALETGCECVHPGYGFVSESPAFSAACAEAGIAFLGPTGETMEQFAKKDAARALARAAGVPVVPGTEVLANVSDAQQAAADIGYPIMLKAVSGGGGMGIVKCDSVQDLEEKFDVTARQAAQYFGDGSLYMEKFVTKPRHIEVQVFGDGEGAVVHFGERECSIQRRNQKVIEEAPSPFVQAHPELRARLTDAAVALAASVNYNSAGTVEFLVDGQSGDFFFLEMNTRLQVEHRVTEQVYDVDLVEWMIRQGASSTTVRPDLAQFRKEGRVAVGHSMEARIYCEDETFKPTPGLLATVCWPLAEDALVDTWVKSGTVVSPSFDPMVAKLVVRGRNRRECRHQFLRALQATHLAGTPTNLRFLAHIADTSFFVSGDYDTGSLVRMMEKTVVVDNEAGHDAFVADGMAIENPGLYTTVQDWPGRTRDVSGVDAWRVGIPPSGPMDAVAHRVGNCLVGNRTGNEATLEFTQTGPTVTFQQDVVFAVTGANFHVTLDGKPVDLWVSHAAPTGSTLVVGTVQDGVGYRGYLCVAGGIDVPLFLGSRSTLVLGALGGHQGRPLAAGDVLHIGEGPLATANVRCPPELLEDWAAVRTVRQFMGPAASGDGNLWCVHVLPGPQASPDFLTAEAMTMFHATEWCVHHNSSRLGVRLIGPKPTWVRQDGGSGGSHPSNVIDNVYAVGTINFTGDMPIYIGNDGPSLGGFVCAVTLAESELWKMGQVQPGDRVRFVLQTMEEALHVKETLERRISGVGLPPGAVNTRRRPVRPLRPLADGTPLPHNAVLMRLPGNANKGIPPATVRAQGDRYVLYEYGGYNDELDLMHRFRIHAFETAVRLHNPGAVRETAPGVRSLQILFDNTRMSVCELLDWLRGLETTLESTDDMVVNSRIVHLPIVLGDRWTRDACQTYMKSVRAEAPYLPDNLAFTARNNGLAGGSDEVKRIMLDASFLVAGLGDVYLGCCAAVPVDPRHRLVTPKYNPARTFTPEGAVGIGGAFMCLYPTASPGGYQLVGRSLPTWSPYQANANFEPGKPWLLRMFDQIRFHEVTEAELEDTIFEHFRHGVYEVEIEETTFSLAQYRAEYIDNEAVRTETAAFRARQRAAAAKENQAEADYWARRATQEEEEKENDQDAAMSMSGNGASCSIARLEEDPSMDVVRSNLTANIWKVHVTPDQEVEKGDVIFVLECMKMEHPVRAPRAGTVRTVLCAESALVQQGSPLAVISATQHA